MTEDEMVGWHHRLNGHEFEQTPGVGDGQGGLVCRSPWGREESETTEGKKRRRRQDKMVGWHHRFNGHEFEQTPGDSEE